MKYDAFIRSRSGKATIAVWLLVVGLLAGLPLLQAQEGTLSGNALRSALQSRYEAIPITDGILLKPRAERLGVRAVEIRGGAVAVNGEEVNDEVLRAWLGKDAEALISLRDLDADEQRELLRLPAAEPAPGSEADPDIPADPDEKGAEVPEPPAAPEAPEGVEPPAPPSPPVLSSHSSGTRIRVAGNVTVDPDEVAEDAVVIGGPLHMKGEVIGDAVTIGSSSWINGKVGGSVAAVAGSVHLGPKAEVMGDVTSVLGSVEKAPGAKVHGDTTEVSGSQFLTGRGYDGWDHDGIQIGVWPIVGRTARLTSALLYLVLLCLFVCLALLLARQPVDRVERRLATDPWTSLGVGLGSLLFFFPLLAVVTLVLIISVVGCLVILLYPILALVLLGGILLGFTAAAYRVGRFLENRFSRSFGNAYVVTLVGVLALSGWTLLGRLFALIGGPLSIFGAFLVVLGFLLKLTASTMGFGAVLLTRFGLGPRVPAGYIPPPAAPLDPIGPAGPIDPIYSADPLAYPADPLADPPLPPENPENPPR